MSAIDYLTVSIPRSRNIATLPSFTPGAGSVIIPNTPLVTTNFTLQGNNGAWVTIDTDEYELDPFGGKIVQCSVDSAGTGVDWSSYTGGFRASWTKDVSGTRTSYSNQSVTFAEDETGFFPIGPEGQINAAFIKNLIANYVYAAGGAVVTNDDGMRLLAEAYPGSTYINWKTTGNELIGEILGEYGGSSGYLYLKGYGKDATYPTGLVIFGGFKYDASAYAYFTLSSAGTGSFDLRAGSNTASGAQAITVQSQTSVANSAQSSLYLDAYTSGTAAAGFGSAAALRGEDNGGTIRDMANVGTIWDVATSASRRSRLYATAFNVSTANTVLTVPYFARVGSMYRKDTSGGTEVSNTTTETSIYSGTIEANELGTDGVIRISLGGDVQQNSGSTINLTFRVKFGGTTVCTLRVAAQNFSGTGGYHLEAMICNAASASAQRAFGSVVLGKTSTFSDSIADYGTASVSTASDQTLSVTVQWASAHSTAKVFSKSTFVELFPS